MRSFNAKITRHFSTLFSPASTQSTPYSYVDKDKIHYLQTYQKFPYYTPPLLPTRPAEVKNFTFNAKPLSPSNPYGQVTEGCSHAVYRAKSSSGKIYYIKDLSESKLGIRTPDEAQFVTHQETFATWIMYQLFGPELIPEVFPVKFKDKWGLASSEIKHFGTLNQLATQLGYTERSILYGESAIKVIDGKTFLLLPDGKEPIRVKGRIAFKVALGYLLAPDDSENSPKNIFMKLILDPINLRQVACPGMFDFGSVFERNQMNQFIDACQHADTKEELAMRLAINPVDAHIRELNVQDYETIADRFLAKETAFRRIAGLPHEQLMIGLDWFKQNSPTEAYAYIEDIIKKYIFCSTDLAALVADKITDIRRNEMRPKEVHVTLKP